VKRGEKGGRNEEKKECLKKDGRNKERKKGKYLV
jgi:hypothetical protein